MTAGATERSATRVPEPWVAASQPSACTQSLIVAINAWNADRGEHSGLASHGRPTNRKQLCQA